MPAEYQPFAASRNLPPGYVVSSLETSVVSPLEMSVVSPLETHVARTQERHWRGALSTLA